MKAMEAMKKMYVPPEIVREIFLRLPCKSLSRFRSISKEYQSHINDLHFIEEHRKHNMKPSHLLIWDHINVTKLHIFNIGMDSYTRIKTIRTYIYFSAPASSCGLVLLQGWNPKKIALLNPLSEEIISLPNLPGPENEHSRMDYLGFGFDPKSRTYKIIQLIVDNQAIVRFHILTVARNDSSWRTVDMPSKSLACDLCYNPLCVDGVLYWEILTGNNNSVIYKDVLVFDLATEEMKIIQSPAKWRRKVHGRGGSLGLMEGKLCCYVMTPPTNMPSLMDIWKLDYDSNNNVNWNLRYNFEIYGLNSKIFPIYPLFIYNGKRMLFAEPLAKGFYCYDIKEKSMKFYPSVEKVDGIARNYRSVVHSETFSVLLE